MKKFTKSLFKLLDVLALCIISIVIWEVGQHFGLSMIWCGGIVGVNASIFAQRNK